MPESQSMCLKTEVGRILFRAQLHRKEVVESGQTEEWEHCTTGRQQPQGNCLFSKYNTGSKVKVKGSQTLLFVFLPISLSVTERSTINYRALEQYVKKSKLEQSFKIRNFISLDWHLCCKTEHAWKSFKNTITYKQHMSHMTALTSERETEGAAYDEKSVHSQAHLQLHLHSSSHGRHDIFRHLCASRRPGLFHSYPCTFTWNLLYMGEHYLRKLVQALSGLRQMNGHLQLDYCDIAPSAAQASLSLSCLFFSLWPWLHGWNHGLIGCACSEWREGGMCLYWGACGAGTCWCSPIWGFGLWVGGKGSGGAGMG